MATLTLHIPEDLKRDLEETKLLGWEDIAISAIRDRIKKLKSLNAMASKSKLTEEDALHLGRQLRKSVHERHAKEYGV